MKDDLISRQAALDALRTCYDTNLIVLDNGDELIHYGDAVGAIDALPSAQPTGTNTVQVEDCISRQAAVNAICEDGTRIERQGRYSMTMVERKQRDVDILENLPSAQPGWIPCSERCPEHRVYVLVTYKPVYGIPDIGITWYSKSEGKWNTSREVLAWMSLPTPYREGGQNETEQ